MRMIKSINEVSGFLASNNQREILDQLLQEALMNIDGLIKYKFYVQERFNSPINKISIVLIIKKEYELVYALNNELNKFEQAFKEAIYKLIHYDTELLLLYK